MTDKITIERETLLPCPFCGDDGDKGRQEVTQMIEGRNKFTRITCRACGAMCPEENWNRRAALAQKAEPPSCKYCDGTGDVHSLGGQWRGRCTECNFSEPQTQKDKEQYAFEDWLASECPSGNVESVQSQWEASAEYLELQPDATEQALQKIADFGQDQREACAAAIRATSATPPKAL